MAITSNVKVSELASAETVASSTLFPVSVVSSIDSEGLPIFLSKKASLGQMSSYTGTYLLSKPNFVDSLCYALEGNTSFMDYVDNHAAPYLTESNDFLETLAGTISSNPDIKIGDAIILTWETSTEATRLKIPFEHRRKNLIVSYSYKDESQVVHNITEKYIGDSMLDDAWTSSSNWTSLATGGSGTGGSNIRIDASTETIIIE